MAASHPAHGADDATDVFAVSTANCVAIQQRVPVPGVLPNSPATNGWRAGAPFGEGTANFEVMREWNRSVVYRKTMALFAEKLTTH